MKLQEGQRVTLNPCGDTDIAVVYRNGDISVTLHGQSGTVIDTSHTLAIVEIDGGASVVVDRVNDPRVTVTRPEALQMARSLLQSWCYYVQSSEAKPRGHGAIRARGIFDGACVMAHCVGYGRTSLHVFGVVRDTLPPGAHPQDYLRPNVVDDLADRLSKVYFGVPEEVHSHSNG